MVKKKILVTTALPYSNGSLHLGHVLEQVQADIWVRFQRMLGHDCVFVCGEDAHGTPVMLKAEQHKISPDHFVLQMQKEHHADCKDFGITFDSFHTTHSRENQSLMNNIYRMLDERGDIVKRDIDQAYDIDKSMFLPDRFIRGQCPVCSASDQYGDHCEACGAVYSSSELQNAVSVLSGHPPVMRTSVHYFFHLNRYREALRHWMKKASLQPQVIHKIQEWLDADLRDWDISRDAPYFGFKIPNTEDKYFYVWMDAPVGYMASFQHVCDQRDDLDFSAWWEVSSTTELYHFIGKDVMYFHILFWPAMLLAAGYRLPSSVFVHGFLTVDGKKMSKSKGTFMTARDYLDRLDPEYLRYYLASKLGDGVDDIDLKWTDFQQKVNADLVGKVVNIASRCAPFIHKGFEGWLAPHEGGYPLYQNVIEAARPIADAYQKRVYRDAMRQIMALADEVNAWIHAQEPWILARQQVDDPRVWQICSLGLNVFRILMIYLKPVVPQLVNRAEQFLQIPPLMWEAIQNPLSDHLIAPFQPLLQRIKADVSKY